MGFSDIRFDLFVSNVGACGLVVVQQPFSEGSSVEHGFCRGECLGIDDNQSLFRIKSVDGSGEIHWVDISDES